MCGLGNLALVSISDWDIHGVQGVLSIIINIISSFITHQSIRHSIIIINSVVEELHLNLDLIIIIKTTCSVQS